MSHFSDHGITELDAVTEAMKNLPWTILQEMKGNTSVLKRIEEAEKLLKSLHKAACKGHRADW